MSQGVTLDRHIAEFRLEGYLMFAVSVSRVGALLFIKIDQRQPWAH